MAYTYDDFVSAANGAGLMDSFSEDDLNIAKVSPEYGLSMLKLQQDINGASTTEQRLLAEEAQKQLRTTYSAPAATAAGAQPSATDTTGSTGSFTYSGQEDLDKLIGKAVNREPFHYERSEDPSYSAYRKQYLREAERAREDTLAKASAATGGTPSSFAVTAAQQAGDYHLTQLADKEVDLEQNAYQRYLNDAQQNISDIGVLTEQRDFDYAAYLNQIEQDNTKFQNAVSLYNTYRYTMSNDQLKQLFSDLGYLTPAVETFLNNMQTPVGGGYVESGSGSSRAPKGDEDTDEDSPGLAWAINTVVENGTDQASTKNNVNKVIDAAVADGTITPATAGNLKRLYRGQIY